MEEKQKCKRKRGRGREREQKWKRNKKRKTKEIRTLQREQLEANKVYNSCKEANNSNANNGGDSSANGKGNVTYDLSTVWRIKKNERIDLGAVQGKFVSRVPPTWTTTMNDNGHNNGNDKDSSGNELRHDVGGVVSVCKGIDDYQYHW